MLIDSFEYMRGKKVILLYSGGLDTVYMSMKLREHDASVIAVKVLLGEDPSAVRRARELAALASITYVEVDRVGQFVEEYLKTALLNGYYADNLYPISASISFPLIARVGVDMAREVGAEAVCHGSDVFQNSMTRFNRSIGFLAPDLGIAALSLIDDSTREAKQDYLRERSIDTTGFRYSVDGNLWCSCVEGGDFDLPDTPANFTTLTAPRTSSVQPGSKDIIITFEHGLPVAIDEQRGPMEEIIAHLNRTGADYALGQFVSWEDTVMFKAREIRLAPAAEILHTALAALINCTLSIKEKEVKSALATVWQGLALKGDWYCDLAGSITSFNQSLSHRLTGKVVLRLNSNKCIVVAASSPGLQKNLSVKAASDPTFMKSAHFAFGRLAEVNS